MFFLRLSKKGNVIFTQIAPYRLHGQRQGNRLLEVGYFSRILNKAKKGDALCL